MRSPMSKIIIDPANLKAGSVMPNMVKMRFPNKKKTDMSTKMENDMSKATARCTLGDSFSTYSKKMGILPIGFKMANIPINELNSKLHSIFLLGSLVYCLVMYGYIPSLIV
jgi:hypothetical protein